MSDRLQEMRHIVARICSPEVDALVTEWTDLHSAKVVGTENPSFLVGSQCNTTLDCKPALIET
jgi:hypothetical protein